MSKLFICLISFQVTFAIDLEFAESIYNDFYKAVETPVNRVQNMFRANFAPTLWCGIRNSAPFPEALSAIYPHLDSCCRSHDLCPFIIERGECFEDVCNPSFLTPILSCNCESEFRECLKSLPSAASLPEFPITWAERLLTDLTGIGYFGILPRVLEHKCILEVPPKPDCKTMDHKSHNCLEYHSEVSRNSSWELISVHRDFNHRDWFQPSNYASDVIDIQQLDEFFSRFVDHEEVHYQQPSDEL